MKYKNKTITIMLIAAFVLSLSGCANYDITFNKVDSMTAPER